MIKRGLAFRIHETPSIYVSPATLWEIGIKDSLGKLTLPEPFEQVFPARLEASNILILPILIPLLHEHRKLPFHHDDPFDRLVIAQALAEGFTLVSGDSEFPPYGVALVKTKAGWQKDGRQKDRSVPNPTREPTD